MKNSTLIRLQNKQYTPSYINSIIEQHLSKYKNVQEMYAEIKKCAQITNGESGFFGIPFSQLIPQLEKQIINKFL